MTAIPQQPGRQPRGLNQLCRQLFGAPFSVILVAAFAIIIGGSFNVRAQQATFSYKPVIVRYGLLSSNTPAKTANLLKSDFAAYVPRDSNGKVVNGKDVELLNFTEVVRIRFVENGAASICTGTIIASDTVLTAGHCGCGSGYEVDIQIPPGRYVNVKLAAGPRLFPGYDCAHKAGIGRDLALIKFKPLEEETGGLYKTSHPEGGTVSIVAPTIRSATLVMDDSALKSLYIVGFGKTETGEIARVLQGAAVSLLSRDCRDGFFALSVCAMYREFVLGHSYTDPSSEPSDSCGGDSGGPAYRMDGDLKILANGQLDRPSKRTLVGVTSRALVGVNHPYAGYCGGGGIYTAVGTVPVLAWLRQNDVNFTHDPSPIFTEDP